MDSSKASKVSRKPVKMPGVKVPRLTRTDRIINQIKLLEADKVRTRQALEEFFKEHSTNSLSIAKTLEIEAEGGEIRQRIIWRKE